MDDLVSQIPGKDCMVASMDVNARSGRREGGGGKGGDIILGADQRDIDELNENGKYLQHVDFRGRQ